MKLSLLVPVYFEEEVIERFIFETESILVTLIIDYEYVFVDDGSKDRTLDILKKHASKNKRIKLISLSYNHGKNHAVTAGLQYVTGDYIIYMDPDLQDPPKEIPRLLNKIQQGFDLVWGIRKEKNDSLKNRLLSKLFWGVLNKYTGLNIPTGIAVMRIFNKDFLEELLKFQETNRFLEGLFFKVGLKQTTLQIEQRNRFAGTSKFNFKRKINLAFDAIFDFSEKPLLYSAKIGVITSLIGFISLVCIAIAKLFLDFQAGWPSLIGISFLGIGLQLFFLGIVAVYVGKIYKESKNRPLYSIREKINL